MNDDYEVLAVRFGTRLGTRAATYYQYGIYGEDDGPLRLDYFVWVIRSRDRVILLDSGFNGPSGTKRKSELVIDPVEALAKVGVDASSVSEIIVSHFHYDHIGNLSSFPQATLTVQRREFEFWTG